MTLCHQKYYKRLNYYARAAEMTPLGDLCHLVGEPPFAVHTALPLVGTGGGGR